MDSLSWWLYWTFLGACLGVIPASFITHPKATKAFFGDIFYKLGFHHRPRQIDLPSARQLLRKARAEEMMVWDKEFRRLGGTLERPFMGSSYIGEIRADRITTGEIRSDNIVTGMTADGIPWQVDVGRAFRQPNEFDLETEESYEEINHEPDGPQPRYREFIAKTDPDYEKRRR